MDIVDFTPSNFQISCITFDANCGPLSEITCLGRPVRLQTWSMYNFDVSSAVMDLVHGAMMVALLSRSTTTYNESKPWEAGRSVIKSMVMIPQISSGTWLGCKGT